MLRIHGITFDYQTIRSSNLPPCSQQLWLSTGIFDILQLLRLFWEALAFVPAATPAPSATTSTLLASQWQTMQDQ